MTKAELIEKLQEGVGQELSKKTIGEVLDAVFENIGQAVKDEQRFSYPGFGTFSLRTRSARSGINPQTGAKIEIKASQTIGFKPAPTLKKKINP